MIELHAHFSGCMRKQTLVDFLIEKEGKDVDLKFLNDNSLLGDFEIFKRINSINLSVGKVQRMAREIISDFHQDGVIYLELRATPKKGEGMDQLKYLQIISETIDEFQNQIEVKLIVSIDRAKGVDEAMKTYQILKNNKIKHIVGIDLCGHPAIGQFSDYEEVLTKCRNLGLKITIHTGELPQSMKEVDEILKFKPDRIGHFIYYNKEQLQIVKEQNIPIEVCFTSNLCTTTLKPHEHQIDEFMKEDIPFAICTDDTLCFNTSVSKEYHFIQQTFNLSVEQLDKFKQNANQMRFA